MIHPSDLDPWCPVCDCEVGVDTWSAGRYVQGFYAALKRHERIVSSPPVRWSDPEPRTEEALTVEICSGSGGPPRILPRPRPAKPGERSDQSKSSSQGHNGP